MKEKTLERPAVRDYMLSPSGEDDILDIDNGMMIIRRRNVRKYLKKYGCPNAASLCDTIWLNYGIFCDVVD